MVERKWLGGRWYMSDVDLAIARGVHACHLFENFGEQKAVLLPFFREGLDRGEHCLYITSQQTADDWYFELQAYGIDVRAELQRGALNVIRGEEWRQTGDFNSIAKAREAWGLIERMLVDFTAIRFAGDAAWALEPPLPVDQLCHWEATANLVYEHEDVRVICQYDLNQHAPAAIHSALRTHPIVILGGRSVSNPYYEAPRILEHEPTLNHSDADAGMVHDMLSRLRSIA